MHYLTLPATKGHIANHIKEAILSRMHSERMGYLAAALANGIGAARASNELRADSEFAALVNDARLNLAEMLGEELIAIADESKGAENQEQVSSAKLRFEARRWFITMILPRFKTEPTKAGASINFGSQTVVVVADEARRRQLIAQHEALLADQSKGLNALAEPTERAAAVMGAARDRVLETHYRPENGSGPDQLLP